MFLRSEPAASAQPDTDPQLKVDFRLGAGLILLVAAIVFTWLTIDGLASRRRLRTELAEISHARYGLLNADRWVERVMPILDAKINEMDLKGPNQASLRPIVQNALYRLLAAIQEKMSTKNSQRTGLGGFLVQGNPLIVNLMIGTIRPHVPEYADVVLAEMGKPETKEALKNYIKSVLADGARSTFGNVDMKRYSSILKARGCADASACQQELGNRIAEVDTKITRYYLTVLVSSAVTFALLMAGRPGLRRSGTAVLVLFCVVLLVGGVLTPMIEVEAKISRLNITFLGEPIGFADQVLYFQSKSVLEVFHTLVTNGRPDMAIVGLLVLMFSIVFPIVKIFTSAFCLYAPSLLRRTRVARFFALGSSKWSMADVMALAIFMAFVAFNGLIANTMGGLKTATTELAIPTDSSKILPGYYLFIGFCLASLFLSKKLERAIETGHRGEQGDLYQR
jgi:paraquat-inducible protein A